MLAYLDRGHPGGSTILFLHGFMGRGADWERVIDHLAPRYRCLAPDLPGHGGSCGLEEGAYSFDGCVAALEEVLRDAGVARCAVVGYSMGGRLALLLASRAEAGAASVVVDRLVLESASPGLADEDERAARRGVDEARALRLESEPFGSFLASWYDQPVFASLARRPELREARLAARAHNDPRELARALRGMGTGTQASLWERLPALKVSTLAVAGALDGKYVEVAERMALASDRIRSVVLPDVGHTVHAEAPAAFADVLRSFLSTP